jgi:hypothetical protein
MVNGRLSLGLVAEAVGFTDVGLRRARLSDAAEDGSSEANTERKGAYLHLRGLLLHELGSSNYGRSCELHGLDRAAVVQALHNHLLHLLLQELLFGTLRRLLGCNAHEIISFFASYSTAEDNRA